jgi:hypothetical protein
MTAPVVQRSPMSVHPQAEPHGEIGDGLAAELVDAVYLVPALVDEDALAALGFRVALAGDAGFAIGFMVGLETRTVVLVGAVDPRLHARLYADHPNVRVYSMREIESPAMALGWRVSDDPQDIHAVDRRRATWIALAARHVRRADTWTPPREGRR